MHFRVEGFAGKRSRKSKILILWNGMAAEEPKLSWGIVASTSFLVSF
jgi:hypothetical protein